MDEAKGSDTPEAGLAGIAMWEARVLAGMKRLHEERMRKDETYRHDHETDRRRRTPDA